MSDRKWQVAVIPVGSDRTKVESFAHWHFGLEQITVVPESELVELQQRVDKLEMQLSAEQFAGKVIGERNAYVESENQRLRELLRRWLTEVGEQANMASDFVLWTDTEQAIGRRNDLDF